MALTEYLNGGVEINKTLGVSRLFDTGNGHYALVSRVARALDPADEQYQYEVYTKLPNGMLSPQFELWPRNHVRSPATEILNRLKSVMNLPDHKHAEVRLFEFGPEPWTHARFLSGFLVPAVETRTLLMAVHEPHRDVRPVAIGRFGI